jgi:hypothetical protein
VGAGAEAGAAEGRDFFLGGGFVVGVWGLTAAPQSGWAADRGWAMGLVLVLAQAARRKWGRRGGGRGGRRDFLGGWGLGLLVAVAVAPVAWPGLWLWPWPAVGRGPRAVGRAWTTWLSGPASEGRRQRLVKDSSAH